MAHMTEDDLNWLAERHPNGEIHTTITELKSLAYELDAETDDVRKATLLGDVLAMVALLKHEIDEDSRAGEDYINDSEFYSPNSGR